MWFQYLTYEILLISIIFLWIPLRAKIKLWMLFFGLSLILAFVSHIANFIAILALLLFYALVSVYNQSLSKWKYVLWLLVFSLGLALELHLIPGFKNLLIWDKIQLTPDAMPCTLYLNFDKTAVGLIILGLTLKLAFRRTEWKKLLKQAAFKLPIILFIILSLTIAFGYTHFEPKFPQGLWIWALSNLFFTCVAEEGLFRGFFQESLSQLKYKYSDYIAMVVPALFFGIIHYPGGIQYVILATVAGGLYGWVYKVTKRIEASILVHFILNLTHILFFTYPALM